MKKILRYSLLSFLLMCCGSIFADEATFVFNTSEGLTALGIAEPEGGAGTDLGDGTYTLNGISLTATDGSTNTRVWKSVNSKTGETTINLRVYKGSDTKPAGTLTFSAGDKYITAVEFNGTISLEAGSGSYDSSTKKWQGSEKSVVFTATATCQINTVKVTYQEGTAPTKKDPGLSFSETSVDAVVGEAFTAPTLTKATTADVKYSSTNTKVATVDETSGAVEIVGAGTAKIRATVEENDEYYGGQAEYQIEAKEPVKDEVTLPYEDLTSGQGSFKLGYETKDEGLSYVWKWDSSNKYMKASAYVSNKYYASESHLVSPLIDLGTATAPTLYFTQCINKFFTNYSDAKLFVVFEDESFETLTLTAPEITSGNWSSFVDEEYDLTPYAGKKIKIEFVYISTSEVAGTWEIKKFKVEDKNATGVNTIKTAEQNANAPMYNLAGQRVSKDYKGIVIQNGRKMIKK